MKHFPVLLAAAAFSVTSAAETISGLTATELVANINVGWNLGNTLDATGVSSVDCETAWGMPKTTEDMILTVKAAGFNAVRIPVSWHDHVSSDGNYTIDSDWMARVKEIVDYAIGNDMYAIINIHHDNSTSYYYPSSDYLSQSKSYVEAIWTQVAKEFADYDQHLIFETLNEPRLVGNTYEWWFTRNSPQSDVVDAITCINTLNQTALDAIRNGSGYNNDRLVMCPGYDASIDGCMTPNFALPTDKGTENRLAVSVHAYTPYNFCLNSSGTSTFTGLESEVDALFSDLSTLVSSGVPAIIGETSASNKSESDEANVAERIEWAKYYFAKSKSYGVPCFLWDNGVYTGGDLAEQHGHLNRNTLKWYDADFIEAIMETLNVTDTEISEVDGVPDLSNYTLTTVFTGSTTVSGWGYDDSLVISELNDGGSLDFTSLDDDDYIVVTYSGETPGFVINGSSAWVIYTTQTTADGVAYFKVSELRSNYGTNSYENMSNYYISIASTSSTTVSKIVIATLNDVTAVNGVTADREVISVEYFSIDGVSHTEPVRGLNLVRTTYSDGTHSVEKILK